jgi:hypothetical protein
MTLLAGSFLWGLFAAATPVAIYLFFRRKRRDISWGSLYILRQVLETRKVYMTWIQYLIVALRTLAVAALVVAFAQPFLPWQRPAEGSFPAAPGGTHRVLLIDTSRSMQARYGAGTALDGALSLTRKILEAGTYPGRVDLLPLDGRRESLALTDFPVARADLERALAECATTSDRADWSTGLQAAVALFRRSPYQRRELYLLGDFARPDLVEDGEPAPPVAWLGPLREDGVRIFAQQYRGEETVNFALQEMTPLGDLVLANQPALYHLTIGCYGQRSAETTLTILDRQGEVLHEELIIAAPGEKHLQVPLTLPPGETTLTARLGGDALPWDNEAERTFIVASRLRVALLQNLGGPSGLEDPRTWLEMALRTPRAPGAGTPDGRDVTSGREALQAREAAGPAADDEKQKLFEVAVEGKIPEQINPELLAETDAVLAVDLASLPAEAHAVLRLYVARGGTLFLLPGPQVDAAEFNDTFRAFAPARLRPPRYEEIDPERYEQAFAEAAGEPLLRELERPEHGDLGNPRFYNYYRTEAGTLAADSRVLLALSEGAPLLLERTLGRGRVYLWTAGLGGHWHSMVVHPTYPVFWIRMLQQAADRRRFARNLQPGAPILLRVETPRAKVVRPDGEEVILQTTPVGGQRVLRYDETEEPGRYDIRTDLASQQPGRLRHVALQTAESDLRPPPPEVTEAFAAAAGAPFYRNEQELIAAVGAEYPGRTLWAWWALVAALCLLLEAALSRIFFT